MLAATEPFFVRFWRCAWPGIAAGILCLAVSACDRRWADGQYIDAEPAQTHVSEDRANQALWVGNHRLVPQAHYDIEARVLSVANYSADSDSLGAVSPLDFALGWQSMSDSRVLARLSLSQGGRIYAYRWRNDPPVPPGDMIRHSANVHLIPATAEVHRQLRAVGKNDRVRLTGLLVDVYQGDKAPPRLIARTSLTRSDYGYGACEIVYVEQVDRLN